MKVTFEKEVGTRLKEFVLIQEISQTAFAQQIGMSRGYVNDVMNGRKGAGPGIVVSVAQAYKKLSLRWLILGEGEMLEAVNTYALPPPELPPGVSEGIKIEYLKREGQLEAMQRVLADHERRLRDLEGK